MEGRTLSIHCSSADPVDWESGAVADALPAEGSVHLWFARLEELRPRYAEFCALLDPVEQQRAERFRSEHDRDRFIIGHGLLRSLLGQYLKRDGSLIRFSRGPFGKPYLERKKLRFNFSDTKDAFLAGFSVGREIGVDIETLSRRVDHAAVSENYFTETEIEGIKRAGDGAKRRFLELWTRKEAVLKASGVGIMDDLRVLRVDAPHNMMTIEHESFVRMAALEYHLRSLPIGDEHLASLAAPWPPENVRYLRPPLIPPPKSVGGN